MNQTLLKFIPRLRHHKYICNNFSTGGTGGTPREAGGAESLLLSLHPGFPLKKALDPEISRIRTLGVFRENEKDDIKILTNNFTSPALAQALRERETTLQIAAILCETGNIDQLSEVLKPFLRASVEKRRDKNHHLDLSAGFTRKELVILQRYLHRMPRQVAPAAENRASVVIPLVNVDGVASVLFQVRSHHVRNHPSEVCFPGGMLQEGVDATIVQTSLREMEEEMGVTREKIEVLGILRCNWNEVASLTGIAVTPVVGYIGELQDISLDPNPLEVQSCFTVTMEALLDDRNWVRKDLSSPVFTGGPRLIWGLTSYLLDKFIKDVVMKCTKRNSVPDPEVLATVLDK